MAGIWRTLSFSIEAALNRHKLVRRLTLIWACWLITVVVLRATDAAVLPALTSAGATVVAAVIGLLATVIGFYQHHRHKEDSK